MAADISSLPESPLLPLAGIRVLEIGSSVSASFATKLLGDLGAEIVKLEPLAGDPLRRQGPFLPGTGETASALFGYLNAGKRCVRIDFAQDAALQLVDDLAGRSQLAVYVADDLAGKIAALFAAHRPGRPAVVALSPFGLDGARAGRAGSGYVAQHSGGWAYHQAYPVTEPDATPPAGCADREPDMLVGLVAANAAMWALLANETTGTRPFVDLSAEDVFAWMLVDALADDKEGRLAPSRRRLPNQGITIAGGLVWFLPCSDGAIMVSPREDHQWARWVEMMGHPAWAADSALCGSRAARTHNSARLQELMAAWSAHQKAHDVFQQAQAARIACFPVSTASDLLQNRQLHARGFFDTLTAAGRDSAMMPGLPFQMRSSGGATLPRGRSRTFPILPPANMAGQDRDREALDV